MKKALGYFQTLILFTAVFTVSVYTQVEQVQDKAPSKLTIEADAISKVIPIKEGTKLRKLISENKEPKLEKAETTFTRQNQNYIRPNAKTRFNRYVNRMVGTGLIGVGASTVVQQISETPLEWEKNSKGFMRRFGSNLTTNAISETTAYALEESLKLDSKFYKSKKKDFGSRLKNAVLSSFTARRPNGKRVFNPSRIAGRYTANVIAAETWYPERYSYKDGLRRGTRGIGFNIGLNFLREFIFPE